MTSDSKEKSNDSNFKKNTANTVFFRYSPAENSVTRKQFESFFSEIGPVKKCSLIRQEKGQAENNKRHAKGYGFCKFTSEEDAKSAAQTLHETYMQLEYGQKVQVWVELAGDSVTTETKGEEHVVKKGSLPKGTPGPDIQTKTTDDIVALQSKKRAARVIIRNLSFYASEHNIRQVMEQQFGEVVEINLPLVPTLEDDPPDTTSTTKTNKKNMKKRPQHRGFAFVTFANKASAQKAIDACSGDGQVLIKKRPVAIDFSIPKVQHKRMKQEEKEENDNDTESESESDDRNDENDKGDDSDAESSKDEEESDEESDDDEDSISTADEDQDMVEELKDQRKEVPKESHKNSVFLRNLPFDTTRHDLFTLFSKYGHIDGIFLVKDKETGIGKGTGFVKFSSEGACIRALEAGVGGGADHRDFKSGRNIMEHDTVSGGIYLRGRRIFVDLAVDSDTASSLKVQRDEDGKPIDKKIGKDKRNLYLKGEGRVESNEGGDHHDPDAWENLPETDQLKRGHAHQEKSTKLRSPLFFINPFRLSIRNLAKHIDEKQLKELVVKGVKRGLEKKLVTKDDMIAHWRASGEMDTRAILEKITTGEKDGNLIPSFDEKKIKQHIPSVFIDRDFQATMKQSTSSKGERLLAPSRGFGFVEFTHHAHAMACLRELNNNTDYSADYVSGGKRATLMKKQNSKKTKKNVKMSKDVDMEDGPSGAAFLGNDGKVRIPRLIVEFTVENKAKARKQAENKEKRLENAKKQKLAAKEAADTEGGEPTRKKKMGRGAQQRAKKRRMMEEGLLDNEIKKNHKDDEPRKKQKLNDNERTDEKKPQEKKKGVKPPKKAKPVDKDEKRFEDLVQSYKTKFSGVTDEIADAKVAHSRVEVVKKRWFDD